MKKLTRVETIDALLSAARTAALDTSCTHPVDIAATLSFAVEYGAETLAALNKQGHIDWERG